MKYFSRFILVLFIFTCLTACSVNPVSGDQDFVLFSEEKEIEIGRTYNSQVLQMERVYRDTALTKYVQDLGDKLAGISHRSNLVYRFTVLDSPDVNAFALPGGYIFIYRGLMSYLSSEEELAAVLGHELGHVTARHSIRQASKAQILDILSYAVGSRVGSTAGNVTSLVSGAFLAGYGRDMELQADSLGAEYMSQVGYSTQGMIEIISVLKEQELYSKEMAERRGSVTQTYHGVFSSHPSNDKRLQEVVRAAEVKSSITAKKPLNLYLNKIDGMVYGDSESDGIRRKDSFYHGGLGIYLTSPKDWEIINTPSTLIFSAPKGEATMSLNVIDLNRRESPKEYLNRLSQGNLFQDRAFKLGGFEAHTGLLIQNSKTHRVAVVFKDKQIFRFSGSSLFDNKEIQKYDNYFLDIINSFRGLKENEKKLTKPLRIKIYKVKPNDSYISLAKNSPIPFDPEKKLRLLNGDYPDKKIVVGRLIKLVE
tara:strand:- start:2425 stop:3864 length:1440 start_codon:yes stop_codon:yes gene_type:complete